MTMDIHATFEEIKEWCAERTALRDPERIEVEFHAVLQITIAESAPPWRVRWERRSSAGIGSPVAHLEYHFETREWELRNRRRDERVRVTSDSLGQLLEEIAADPGPWLPEDLWQRMSETPDGPDDRTAGAHPE